MLNRPWLKRNLNSWKRSNLSKYSILYSAKINRTNHPIWNENGINQKEQWGKNENATWEGIEKEEIALRKKKIRIGC